ncbi:MAG: restriction endonuclease [Gammaproteobacteria bacterium]|nr:restriction endonuclease [Gammaproteobacteria bacterium]MDE0444131.1 restriction endonuclease [Gammaproteobacteria bacterium]
MTTLTVHEWQELSIGTDGLTEAAAGRLHKLAERETRRLPVAQPILTRTAAPGLRAGQVVGVLTVPGACLEILPKIGGEQESDVRRSLIRMLAVALRLPIADSEPSLMDRQERDLLEILVQRFADGLLASAKRGLPHRYRQREEDLPLLRGKLDIRRQLLQHAARAERLACVFEELSVDTPLNRVLRAAVVGLAHVVRTADNRRKLNELVARLEFVADTSDPLREPVMLDRTNTAFHRLYALARLFLAGDWQSTSAGRQEGFGLLFAMNDLFEAFVGRSMQAALAPTGRFVRLQRRDRHALDDGREGFFELKPDIVVDDIVIDTKWKSLCPGKKTLGVEQSDVYQMLAYSRAYQATRLVLLYPWQHGLPRGVCRTWHVSETSTLFEVATVDVSKPDHVKTALRELVEGPSSSTHRSGCSV